MAESTVSAGAVPKLSNGQGELYLAATPAAMDPLNLMMEILNLIPHRMGFGAITAA
ncbi:MAG TPA: hypothetical protein VL860_13475 [Planctomycetota bacterium]|nr:hypothetical protein [Planctomycetota bacterium]